MIIVIIIVFVDYLHREFVWCASERARVFVYGLFVRSFVSVLLCGLLLLCYGIKQLSHFGYIYIVEAMARTVCDGARQKYMLIWWMYVVYMSHIYTGCDLWTTEKKKELETLKFFGGSLFSARHEHVFTVNFFSVVSIFAFPFRIIRLFLLFLYLVILLTSDFLCIVFCYSPRFSIPFLAEQKKSSIYLVFISSYADGSGFFSLNTFIHEALSSK